MSLSETVSSAGLAFWAEAALVLFFVAFGVVLMEVLRKRTPESLRHESSLPLKDDDRPSRTTTVRATPEAIRHGQ
jgi:hypothetical protein